MRVVVASWTGKIESRRPWKSVGEMTDSALWSPPPRKHRLGDPIAIHWNGARSGFILSFRVRGLEPLGLDHFGGKQEVFGGDSFSILVNHCSFHKPAVLVLPGFPEVF